MQQFCYECLLCKSFTQYIDQLSAKGSKSPFGIAELIRSHIKNGLIVTNRKVMI